MHYAKLVLAVCLAFLLIYEAWAGATHGLKWTLSYAVWDMAARCVWFSPVCLAVIAWLSAHLFLRRKLWPPFARGNDE